MDGERKNEREEGGREAKLDRKESTYGIGGKGFEPPAIIDFALIKR